MNKICIIQILSVYYPNILHNIQLKYYQLSILGKNFIIIFLCFFFQARAVTMTATSMPIVSPTPSSVVEVVMMAKTSPVKTAAVSFSITKSVYLNSF